MKLAFFLGCLLLACPLAAETKVLAFSGSTREDSYNKKLVLQAAAIAKNLGAKVTVIDLKDYSMPFYDGDLEKKQGMPSGAKKLRKLMSQSDAIMIATPEYNGSVSAVLKNALDWASRSEDGNSSRDAFKDKKFAIMSASQGKGGGVRALANLRSIIEGVGGTVIAKQVAVPEAQNAFDDKGSLKDAAIKKQLEQEVQQLLSGNGATSENTEVEKQTAEQKV